MLSWPRQGQDKALAEDCSWCPLEKGILGGRPKEGGSVHTCVLRAKTCHIRGMCSFGRALSSLSTSCFCCWSESSSGAGRVGEGEVEGEVVGSGSGRTCRAPLLVNANLFLLTLSIPSGCLFTGSSMNDTSC